MTPAVDDAAPAPRAQDGAEDHLVAAARSPEILRQRETVRVVFKDQRAPETALDIALQGLPVEAGRARVDHPPRGIRERPWSAKAQAVPARAHLAEHSPIERLDIG